MRDPNRRARSGSPFARRCGRARPPRGGLVAQTHPSHLRTSSGTTAALINIMPNAVPNTTKLGRLVPMGLSVPVLRPRTTRIPNTKGEPTITIGRPWFQVAVPGRDNMNIPITNSHVTTIPACRAFHRRDGERAEEVAMPRHCATIGPTTQAINGQQLAGVRARWPKFQGSGACMNAQRPACTTKQATPADAVGDPSADRAAGLRLRRREAPSPAGSGDGFEAQSQSECVGDLDDGGKAWVAVGG